MFLASKDKRAHGVENSFAVTIIILIIIIIIMIIKHIYNPCYGTVRVRELHLSIQLTLSCCAELSITQRTAKASERYAFTFSSTMRDFSNPGLSTTTILS